MRIQQKTRTTCCTIVLFLVLWYPNSIKELRLVLNNLAMEVTTYSNFRQNLKTFLDEVLSSNAPLYVKRTNGEDVVVISKSDYESMEETLYLLSSEKNRKQLMKGVEQTEKGETTKVNIKDLWK